MKTTIYLFIVLFSLSNLNSFAQSNAQTSKIDSTKTILTNLKSLPRDVREKQLVKLAKATVLRYMPDYYRDIKPAVIQCFEVSEKTKDMIDPKDPIENKGRFFYSVKFLHDSKEEFMSKGYAAYVYIWEDTGFAFKTGTGQGWGYYNLDEMAEEQKNKLPVLRYEKIPPMTIVKDTIYKENGEIKEIRFRRVD